MHVPTRNKKTDGLMEGLGWQEAWGPDPAPIRHLPDMKKAATNNS